MPEQQSRVRLTSSEAREEFMERAADLWDSFNAWYKTHPEATFDEMEEELGRQRRTILGNFLELNLRQGDLGAEAEVLSCPQCGRLAEFKGYPPKTVHGLEVDARIPRAYYYCPSCKAGFSPPGSTAPVEEGQLE
jgi:hypothetical protein